MVVVVYVTQNWRESVCGSSYSWINCVFYNLNRLIAVVNLNSRMLGLNFWMGTQIERIKRIFTD
ncbi:hypothetical protein DUE52_25770 [Larkinella punicea]|uniref:Uncharacterized protein n=1 Tax=Larkinella punicea TaxID=2315727 RepID=A0A368JGB3_9BACT|nr:hypothetical protein DUE52_25770 [Larkinella punicea]